MSATPAEIQACVSSQCPRNSGAGESCTHALLPPTDDGGSQDRVERIYHAHPQVEHIAVFSDRLGHRVALVVSEVHERKLRGLLDDIARHSPECACLADFVALAPDDPLVAALLPAGVEPRRELIWQLLVGCIETLTLTADRISPTGERPSCPLTCSRLPHGQLVRRGVG